MIDLFRTRNVCIRAAPADDVGRWVITFDNFGLGPGFDRLGFGQVFLANAGVSAIHVMGAGDDWYQYPEMAEAMAAVRARVEGAGRIMTYGSSMGGYAALRFAKPAAANAVLALSPQHNIDPARAPYDDRWTQAAARIRWRPELAGPMDLGEAKAVVVFDPCSRDRDHVRLIASEAPIQPIALPYGGHPISSHLAEIGLLKRLFFDVLEGRLDARAFRAQARATRNTPVYLTELSKAAAARRLETALTLAERGAKLTPWNTRVLSNLGALQIQAGRRSEGIETLARAVEFWRTDTTLIPYANALADEGRLNEAKMLAEEVVQLQPRLGYIRLWQAGLAWRAEDYAEARSACIEALRLDPGNGHAAELAAACEAVLRSQPETGPHGRAKGARRLARTLRRGYRRLVRR